MATRSRGCPGKCRLGSEASAQAGFMAGQNIAPTAVEIELTKKRLLVVGVKTATV
jgi:hypothetical protein